MTDTTTSTGTLDTLRAGFTGSVLTPADDDYATARAPWNGAIAARPAVIARCATPDDVGAALAHARGEGLEIGVRGGAHSYGGAPLPEGGLTVDLSLLRHVVVDPAARRARCGGGVTQGELDAATQQHGLAVTGGTISHTGVGGLTLGGGMGWLTRRCGLAVDNLRSAQVVLADGRCVRAAPDSHPDLFWALTGGGGNFGVVTEFEFALHPVGPIVHFGLLFWEIDRGAAALRVARDVADALPRDCGALIAGFNAPPAPFVPEAHHHTLGIALLIAGLSDAQPQAAPLAEARAALHPLFEVGTDMPYTALQQILDDAAPWGIHAYGKALYLDELSDAAIDVIAGRLPAKVSPMSLMPIFPLGGAFADVAEDDTAFGGRRSARYAVNIDAATPDPRLLPADREWVRSTWDALRPHAGDSGSYVNFMTEFEPDRVAAAYGPVKFARLAAIKASYDPDNVFHRNANIPPA
ncbi:FAD-binding oxidoreductase [Pseudonocardia sp. D17]|uniref:FAD-binding oxidoreductase n=1 Tax=Pseudonocardia sp. D17 TaxID=882661 RepID=UPI002B3E3C1E|nr:FAD-linked oxidase [Pseudonocardia sp. D17]